LFTDTSSYSRSPVRSCASSSVCSSRFAFSSSRTIWGQFSRQCLKIVCPSCVLSTIVDLRLFSCRIYKTVREKAKLVEVVAQAHPHHPCPPELPRHGFSSLIPTLCRRQRREDALISSLYPRLH